jgi:hypothetical protein
MSRLVVPITGKMLWHTGDVRLWADVDLHLKDGSGNWHRRTFRVDCATDVTTFPAFDAKQMGLPLPAQPSLGVTHAQTGLAIRSGLLRFRIDGMDATEYTVACFFLGDPDTPSSPSQMARLPRALLQPFQLVDRLRFILDKDPMAGSLYGDLVIVKK